MRTQKIRTGIIGVGGMGRAHVRQILKTPEMKLVALCDISPASIAATHEKFPETQKLPVYEDYREMLEKEKLDAVEIVTPHTLHYPMAMDSLDAGCHLLMEKPMVCTVEHALALRARVRELKKVLLLSYQRHYDPKFREIKRIIAEEVIGKLEFVSVMQGQGWYPAQRGKWRQDPELSGGGQLNDSGSHMVDIVHWVTGQASVEVFSTINMMDTKVDINSAITWKFANGAQGNMSVIGNFPGWWEDHTYSGSKGSVLIRQGKLMLVLYGKEITEPEPKFEPILPEWDFVKAIQTGGEVASTATDGLRVIEFTEAAWQSAKTGKLVKIARHD